VRVKRRKHIERNKMKERKKIAALAACVCALVVAPIHQAKATFQPCTGNNNPDCTGLHAFVDVHHAGTTNFNLFVGKNNSSNPNVNVTTNGTVSTGSGFANIKADSMGTLTQLVFVPQAFGGTAGDLLFGDFSFRGQLFSGSEVDVTVVDQLGNSQTFDFTGLQHDPHDFNRLGVFSTDETIAMLTITSPSGSFFEVKQIEFSSGQAIPTPEGGATLMLLGGALCVLGVARRFLPERKPARIQDRNA
jgi:hypothetical protein